MVNPETEFIAMIPVIPSANIIRDVDWYIKKTGFTAIFSNQLYAVLCRDNLTIHLQWHADTTDDPLLGGSVIRIRVKNLKGIFEEFVERATITRDALKSNTPWHTNEFGFFDLNKNAIFISEDAD